MKVRMLKRGFFLRISLSNICEMEFADRNYNLECGSHLVVKQISSLHALSFFLHKSIHNMLHGLSMNFESFRTNPKDLFLKKRQMECRCRRWHTNGPVETVLQISPILPIKITCKFILLRVSSSYNCLIVSLQLSIF